ncbi:uncharacterized protein BO97DRAFT_39309 [Aspergillus homomorphus CBS 101889]|uniref:Zn(2)-C6 fungal-type domain-containing protein n=1 Tax=Aspergillus homomorphus (strain CBS 101889) TaxID=1450537 RepID=A0A395I085_ASPHC|nr:hypothetical protein BO97DRAFT_39309 [Aspergillus homomorphus CBS 101889]RAL13470.1 hypothetical protein BO97DRAFT_39309 [Aspergillus homomorphus CBS 101889]
MSAATSNLRRISQRQSLACRECTKSKRKCSKTIPCTRCSRLRLSCTREIVQLQRSTVRYGAEVDFLSSLAGDLDLLLESTSATALSQLPHIISKVRDRIFLLQTGLESTPDQQAPPHIPELPLGEDEKGCHAEPEGLSLLTAIEHLAWGRDSAGCFPHMNCGCQYSRSKASKAIAYSPQRSYGLGVDASSAEKLIRFHLCHMAWHHDCIHAPTFLEQCERFWKTGEIDHPLWMALYSSVLGATVFAMRVSSRARAAIDVNLDMMPPADQLLTTMLEALYNGHFLEDMSVYSLQAIVISTEIAHNLGRSQLNATLFKAAVRIAECLGIHRIREPHGAYMNTEETWIETVEREVGKRVWCQMVIQDHFAIPFTDTYSISPSQYSTGPPLNADDYDLTGMPPTVPTVSSYVRVLREIADLMPSLVDGLGSMSRPKPLRDQYAHILMLDQRMRFVVKGFPSFLLQPDVEKELEIPWLGIARRSLAITAAEKIIMIHRPFLFLSFNSSSYQYTRRTCVAAALTILREHETIINQGDFFVWTHSAFCITAAIILCFEVSVAPNNVGPETDKFRVAIQAARGRLANQTSDILAQRGVALIDAVFASEGNLDLGFYRAVADVLRFGQSKAQGENTATPTPFLPDLGFCDAYRADGSPSATTADSQINLGVNADNMDFELWFNDIFYHFSGEAA